MRPDAQDQIRATFFAECDELIEAVEEVLGRLWPGGGGTDDLNALFRAVHSIKGGAAAFRFDDLTGYAHALESVLDAIRGGAIGIDGQVHGLLVACADGLAELVQAARDGTRPSLDRGQAALDGLGALGRVATAVAAPESFAPVPVDFELFDEDDVDAAAPEGPVSKGSAGRAWEISLAPRPAFYAYGNEPLWLFRALRRLGQLEVVPDVSRLPDLEALDPAHSYLAWTARLATDVSEERIRSVFEFAEGLCDLRIAPCRSAVPLGPDADGRLPRLPPVPAQEAARRRPPPRPKVSVRVDAERIDRLIALAGELVAGHAVLAEDAALNGPQHASLTDRITDLRRLSRELQETAMTTRAQPIKALFQRLGRVAREAAAVAGRKVRLSVEGEMTEVDKTLLDALVDPLTQIVRNAVDHGIEPPGIRARAGKDAEGQITLAAVHRASRLIVEIADDGAGIDRQGVLRSAVTRGLVAGDDNPSDAESDELVFAPGLSTAAAASRLSGRGVGLDVVRATIASLGGQVVLRSTAAAGTTFTLSLPMTLTPVSGTLVAAAGRHLVVPTTALVRIEPLPAAMDGDVPQAAPTAVIGTELADLRDPCAKAARGGHAVIVARRDGSRLALGVDHIEGHVQAVILGVDRQRPGLSFATLTSTGEAVRIVDPDDMRALLSWWHDADLAGSPDCSAAVVGLNETASEGETDGP